VLARVWSRLFGTGEVGLRSLSALVGTVTVPVAFLVGRALASRAAGLVAASLVAFSPMLFWYSQEARSYALFALLVLLSLLFYVQALEAAGPRALVWWAVVAVLALATHYFAVFPVAAEAASLLVSSRLRDRSTAIAVAATIAAGVALIPLVVEQYASGDRAAFIATIPLRTRIDETARQFLTGQVGFQHLEPVTLLALLVLTGAAVLAGRAAVVPLARDDGRRRDAASLRAHEPIQARCHVREHAAGTGGRTLLRVR
jgi:mannosyltransferase